ncbi:hypothetical protein ALT785_240190 [Alteromonas infernus]
MDNCTLHIKISINNGVTSFQRAAIVAKFFYLRCRLSACVTRK